MDKIQLKKTLLTVIISLEKQFNIKFSYAVEDVANIAIENRILPLRYKKQLI
jgi:hypothetical protein